jgi:hypothetical protein
VSYRATVLLALLAGAAAAKPPVVPGYARIGEAGRWLNEVYAELKAKEDFAGKCFEEQLVIKLREGAKSWGRVKPLTAEAVVKELLEEWGAAQQDKPPGDVVRILGLLAEVLDEKFGGVQAPKDERYKASLPLVAALTNEHLAVRQAAIDCLTKIYGSSRFFWPNLRPAERKSRQREWYSYIRRMKG